MVIDVPTLLTLTDTQLNDTFRAGVADPIPDGSAKGTAIVANGTALSPDIADAVKRFVWQGKTFDRAHGVLRNRISAFGINAIVAEVYKGPSQFDGQPCIVLDYSKTSLVASWIRDEIRLVAPKVYLGLVYAHDTPTLHFALEFD
jgi:hypothetical protein